MVRADGSNICQPLPKIGSCWLVAQRRRAFCRRPNHFHVAIGKEQIVWAGFAGYVDTAGSGASATTFTPSPELTWTMCNLQPVSCAISIA